MIEWRYGDQLDWRLVVIGLSEDASRYAEHGFTPQRLAIGNISFRERFGMPFAGIVKSRLSASSPACRAIVAARLQSPGSEWRVFRALQLANFNSDLAFDDEEQMREVLATVEDIDPDRIIGSLESLQVLEAYEQDKALTRTAAGSATELQGKAGMSDGAVRYTAPSVWFETPDGRRLEAGGFQPVEAYDVLIANLDPTLRRQGPPETPEALLEFFHGGLTSQEVAALMTPNNGVPDRAGAEQALFELVGAGVATRTLLGNDAIWQLADGHGNGRVAVAAGASADA